jgi:hypothetical protein
MDAADISFVIHCLYDRPLFMGMWGFCPKREGNTAHSLLEF